MYNELQLVRCDGCLMLVMYDIAIADMKRWFEVTVHGPHLDGVFPSLNKGRAGAWAHFLDHSVIGNMLEFLGSINPMEDCSVPVAYDFTTSEAELIFHSHPGQPWDTRLLTWDSGYRHAVRAVSWPQWSSSSVIDSSAGHPWGQKYTFGASCPTPHCCCFGWTSLGICLCLSYSDWASPLEHCQ